MDMKKRYESDGRMGLKSVVIDGIPPSTCIVCQNFTTSIDFDMDLHLFELHRSALLRLPIGSGKGLYFSLKSRIEYAINEGRKVYEAEAGE